MARIRNFKNFVRLIRGLPPTRTGVSNAGAKQAGEAIHARGGGGGGTAGAFSGTSATDSHLGKAIASGHQEKVYGDPASKNRVVGYGGQAPRHRKKSSGLVIVLLSSVVPSDRRVRVLSSVVDWDAARHAPSESNSAKPHCGRWLR